MDSHDDPGRRHDHGHDHDHDQLPPTDHTRVRRRTQRARYDRATVHAILDEAAVLHVGLALPDGQPVVIPMAFARVGRTLILHGAAASRLLGAGAAGVPLCATATLVDGLVLARSAFHHSVNYRSAVVMGRAREIVDPAEKARAMAVLIDHLVPGRSGVARAPTEKELAATRVVALPIEEASAKVRTGPPLDDDEDLTWPAWAGVVPLALRADAPVAAAGPGPGAGAGAGARAAEPAATWLGPLAPAAGAPSPAPAVEARHGDDVISDDRARVDFARVSGWLAGAYWSPGIPRAAVEESARGSALVAGAYAPDGAQVGYLRVVSDGVRFAFLMDVYVAPGRRRQGLGRALVRFALGHPRLRAVPRWLLGTHDAHGVYAPLGFAPVDAPERLMQRVVAAPWAEPPSAARHP